MMLNVGKTVDGAEHIDGFASEETENLKWFSGCYYIKDSDGDTTIVLPDGSKKSVEPKQDSFVVFDGNYVHSGQLPLRSNRRIVVNVNFLGEQI